MAKPASFTASCTTFTHADVSRPPAVKYTVMTPPPIEAPDRLRHAGDDVRGSMAIAISWPARMASEPIQSSSAIDAADGAAVAQLEVVADGLADRGRAAIAPDRAGRSRSASTIEPIAADPTHHQAATPSR